MDGQQSSQTSEKSTVRDDDTDDDDEEVTFKRVNIIFIPFKKAFQFIVLICVILKCSLGPLQMVFPFINCSDVSDSPLYLFIKYAYLYVCDIVYSLDTFLYIVHRQVEEEAMKREYPPKSAICIMLDLMSLIPIFRLLSSEMCPTPKIWPNLMGFNEFLIIYRVIEYFSLITTHSYFKLILGYSLLMMLSINCIGCAILLMTYDGLCSCCHNNIMDWRMVMIIRFNDTSNKNYLYLEAICLVNSFIVHVVVDNFMINTIQEYKIVTVFIAIGFCILIFINKPKLFAEGVRKMRRISEFHPRVKKIVEETRIRNIDSQSHYDVEKYYSLLWRKNQGIKSLPKLFQELPHRFKDDVNLDLFWEVFNHSPTFRNTSIHFKKVFSSRIRIEYRLPGDPFFIGRYCNSNLYYIKSGIVQLISSDDITSPLLSVKDGTIFGDVSFYVPLLHRNVIARCLTFCEVHVMSRDKVLKCLQLFPEDRNHIMMLVQKKIKHGRTLYAYKQHVQSLDRSEDEGIAWIKKRWWAIYKTIYEWKKLKKSRHRPRLPDEETSYHCPKYIGQLVLCPDVQLQRQTMFIKLSFPWVLRKHSGFGYVWHYIVLTTVYLVLILYPPNITRINFPTWFRWFHFFVDVIYIMDIVVSLVITVEKQDGARPTLLGVMMARLKSPYFILDLLATPCIDQCLYLIKKTEVLRLFQFNRLLKVYMIFYERYKINWNRKYDPTMDVTYKIGVLLFIYLYVFGYFLFSITEYSTLLNTYSFFNNFCPPSHRVDCIGTYNILHVCEAWIFENFFPMASPSTVGDIILQLFLYFWIDICFFYVNMVYISSLYLKFRKISKYQFLVVNMKQYMKHHKIHRDVLAKLVKYLNFHWKYHHGKDVLEPNVIFGEPHDIYRKVQGELAAKIIKQSNLLNDASNALINELAHAAKILVISKDITLYKFGIESKKIFWIVKGSVRAEYISDDVEKVTEYYTKGLLSLTSIFLGKPSMTTFITESDCEILYIPNVVLVNILKQHPLEWASYEDCLKQFMPIVDKVFQSHLKRYQIHEKKKREEYFQKTSNDFEPEENEESNFLMNVFLFFQAYRQNPESLFTRIWMPFRAMTAALGIITGAIRGGGINIRNLNNILFFCDVTNYLDILIKLFLPYYDDRGLIITNFRKCILHYMTRGLILDIMPVWPWETMFKKHFNIEMPQHHIMIVETISQFATLHLVIGYINYISDVPTKNYALFNVLKCQIVGIFTILSFSQYLISLCVDFEWNDNDDLVRIEYKNNCWMPEYYSFKTKLVENELDIITAHSICFAQCAANRFIYGMYNFGIRSNSGLQCGYIFMVIGVTFWFLKCYSLTQLIVHMRGETVFHQHRVEQLRDFLVSERLEKAIINRTVNYFSYWWLRTKGFSLNKAMTDHIATIFEHEIQANFYRRTFEALGSVLQGGTSFQQAISNVSLGNLHMPAGEDIVREEDLVPFLYIVHRGKVTIYQKEKKITELTKGCIFGQVVGGKIRPIRITARAENMADVLQISYKDFHDIITDKIKLNIAQIPQSEDDYLKLPKRISENPFYTLQYLLRGQKTIKLPWMSKAVEARNSTWYSKWLILAWVLSPGVTIVLVLMMHIVPLSFLNTLIWLTTPFDVLHLINFVSEFFTMDLEIEDNICVLKYNRLKQLTLWGFYFDIVSLVVPLGSFFTGDWEYQIAKCLRTHLFFRYRNHVNKVFETGKKKIMLKIGIFILLFHLLTCGWVLSNCRDDKLYPLNLDTPPNGTYCEDEWHIPSKVRPYGCQRIIHYPNNGQEEIGFLVPNNWRDDYLIALLQVLVVQIRISIDIAFPIKVKEVYYLIFLTHATSLIEIWITSVAIITVYNKIRGMYAFHRKVTRLVDYLKLSGVSERVTCFLEIYTNLLWNKRQGNLNPELLQYAPMCLKQDIESALYMHHLLAPTIFRECFPLYFKRQLATRFGRRILYPGRQIVQAGDIRPTIYFIHEGEVEKWCTDSNGEFKLVTVLFINGYFGLTQGLYPHIPYQFTFISRTIVDLIFLAYDNWKDLLNGYPKIKNDLYKAAAKLKKYKTS